MHDEGACCSAAGAWITVGRLHVEHVVAWDSHWQKIAAEWDIPEGTTPESAQKIQLDRVREVLNRRRKVRPSCRLALLNVKAAKQAVRDALGDEALGVSSSTVAVDVVEDPIVCATDSSRDDPSHAHIVLPELPADHEVAAAALRDIVRPGDMRCAVQSCDGDFTDGGRVRGTMT